MNNTSFKNIRVLSGGLDFNSNTDKTLEKILLQLQSSLSSTNIIVGKTQGKNAVLLTKYGDFQIPNNIKLKSGDKVDVIFSMEGEVIKGSIISVNSKKLLQSANTQFYLPNVNKSPKYTSSTTEIRPEIYVNLSNITRLPKEIYGSISYLNLSKIREQSGLFGLFSRYDEGANDIPITLHTGVYDSKEPSLYQVVAEVSSNDKGNVQLLKTDFGIIASENTNLAIGQKLVLEIATIGGHRVGLNLQSLVTDFMFKVRENWELLTKLLILIQKNGGVSKKNQLQNLLQNLVESRDLLKDLSADMKEIKDLLRENNPGILRQDSGLMVMPFYQGEKIEDYEIEIKENNEKKNLLQFLIKINLSTILGKIELGGMVVLNKDKSPQKLDLTIKSEKPLDGALQTRIYDNFNLSKLSGSFEGTIKFA